MLPDVLTTNVNFHSIIEFESELVIDTKKTKKPEQMLKRQTTQGLYVGYEGGQLFKKEIVIKGYHIYQHK